MSHRTVGGCYRELGAELRKLREAAGLNEVDVSRKLNWTPSKISRIENGFRKASIFEVIEYLGKCGIFGKYGAQYHAMCREAELNQGHWLRRHEPGLEDSGRSLIYHEATAHASTSYEPQVVPGLLQTEDYVRAVASEQWPDSDIDAAVRMRKERQRILRRDSPAKFAFYVHEHALRLKVGSAAVMHEQLLALLLFDGLQRVTIRVVPASAGAQALLGGSFRLFEFPEHRPLVYLDGPFSGVFLEDREYVDDYRALIPIIASTALDEGQSREWLATLASHYDRERVEPDAHDTVEEEQLQPRRY